MGFAELQREVEKLDEAHQRRLRAFLFVLDQRREHEDWPAEMARRLDDEDPAHWISLEEVQRRLGDRP